MDITIDIFDDSSFVDSPDTPTKYDKVFQVENDKPYRPTSQHAIKLYKHDKLINSGIILASGGGTGVHDGSALIDDGDLIIRCCNKLFSLTIPALETNWVIEADPATCFSIHKYHDTYICHGELLISRIAKNGKILWSYGGYDIFDGFAMHDNYISLKDFNGSTYRINYEGKTLEYIESAYHRQKPITVFLRSQKPWWKFW